MNLIWRFYRDEHRQWRWQQRSIGGDIIADSTTGHSDYESCMADAKGKGYDFQPAQPGRTQVRPTHR
jgi:hypothetical protein